MSKDNIIKLIQPANVDDQLTEILVARQQHRLVIVCLPQDLVVRHARRELGNIEDIITIVAKPLHDRPIDAFISKHGHADFALTGYTTSARSASAAKRRAASTPSRVNRG